MKQFTSASDLPEQWDENLSDNLYLRREFLVFLESVDSSEKSYYMFQTPDGKVLAKMMMHTRKGYNLTMFSGLKTSIKMQFVYFPLSVSRPAIVCCEAARDEVAAFLKSIKGYKMILNVTEDWQLVDFTRGLTCPRCVLSLRWNSFNNYLRELRSGYRRRYKKALEKSAGLNFYFLENNQSFDERLYDLYLEVYNRSKYKLEKLSIDFFRGERFKIFVLVNSNDPVGFVQLLDNGAELIFEFVGFSHCKNREYDIYIRLLLEIVRYGIENNYQTIDFGQTADDAKLKLGCYYEPLYALVHHSNPVINRLIRLASRHIQYKPLDERGFHVFREGGV